MSMQTAFLGEIMIENQKSIDPKKNPKAKFALYSIPSFDAGAPEICEGTAIGSTKKCLEPGDVVLSRIIPHIRRAWVVGDHDVDHIVGSSEWIVFRSPKIHGPYLRHIVTADPFHAQFMNTVAGVGGSLVRARPKAAAQIKIPLPPIDEQRRIAGILDAADALRRRRREALALLDTLPGAIFAEMFGDPANNPHGYKPGTISDLLDEVRYGTSNKAGAEGALPVLRMGNITYAGRMDLGDLKRIDLPEKDLSKHTVRKGDILFNRTNSADLVGKTAIFQEDEPYAFAGYLVRARVSNGNRPEYVSGYLNSPHGKKVLRNMAKNIVGMANINAKEMQSIPILLAPEDKQERYAECCAQIDDRRAMLVDQLSHLESFFASLQSRAFAGEL